MNNKSFWNRYASVYDKIIGNKINNKELFNFILKYTGKDDRLIEAACGTGAFTCLLSPNLGEIIAFDYSEEMVKKAKNKTKNLKNVEVSVGDLNNINYEDNYFDVALAANVLHLLDKPETAISELTRVVKDNGILILPTYVKGNTFQRLMLKTLKLFIFESNEWSKNEYLCFLKNHDLEILDYDVFNAGQPLCVAIIKNSK